jgi:NAD(P)H dehydrogenase (quinone)
VKSIVELGFSSLIQSTLRVIFTCMQQQLDVAVLAAGGAQGEAITAALAEAGAVVCALTRATAPFDDEDALAASLDGADVVVFTAPLDYSSAAAMYPWAVAAAASASGVQRIVFNANTRVPEGATSAVGFESRRAALEVLSSGAVPVTVVEPAIYLDNLLAPGVLLPAGEGEEGLVLRYPVPDQLPVSWLALTDLGRAVAAACLAGRPGQVLRPGPPARTANGLAAAIGSSLGTSVRFETLDPDVFEEGLALAVGAGPAAGVASIYRWLADNPDSSVMAAPVEQPEWMPVPEDAVIWASRHLRSLAPR